MGMLLLLLPVTISQVLFGLSFQMLAKVLQLSMRVTPILWKLGVPVQGRPAEARTDSRNTELTSHSLHLQAGQMEISQRKRQGLTCNPPKESSGRTSLLCFRAGPGLRHQPRLTAPKLYSQPLP